MTMSIEANVENGAITRLLARARAGDKSAEHELWKLVDVDVRRIAQTLVNRNGYGSRTHAGGTDLVNEAYLCLVQRNLLDAEDRKEFFRFLGQKMRDLIVERHRRDSAVVHGGDWERVSLPADLLADLPADEEWRWDTEDVRKALDELRLTDEESARTIDLLYIQKVSLRQAARLMQCTVHAVLDNRRFALTWLRVRLG